MKQSHAWVAFALGSAAFAALTAFFGKLGVATISSNLATWVRTVVILALCSVVVTFRHEWKPPAAAPASTWAFLVLSGLAAGLSWLCYYRALQLGPLSKVAPVDKLSVVFALLLGIVFLGESLTWPVALGGFLIAAGSIVMVLG